MFRHDSLAAMVTHDVGEPTVLRIELVQRGANWQATIIQDGRVDQQIFGSGAGPDVFAIARACAAPPCAQPTDTPAGWRVLAGGRSRVG